MPWSASDAQRFTKSASTKGKSQVWKGAANGVLAKTGDEGQAIRIANAAVKKAPPTTPSTKGPSLKSTPKVS